MKCPKCGAEVEGKFCSYCGTQITAKMRQEQEIIDKAGCPKCHSSNIQFKRENHGEKTGKNSKVIIHKTAGFCKDCGHTWFPQEASKQQKKTDPYFGLWVLGWILFFPIPLTVLIVRAKWPKWVRGIAIAALWIFVIGAVSSNQKQKNTAKEAAVETVTDIPEDKTTITPEPTLELVSEVPEQTNELTDKQEALREAFKDNVCDGSATFYESVRNDKTGNWRELVYYGSENILDHVPEYYAAYFKDDNEIHIVVNLGLKTTAVLNMMPGNIIDVTIHEYVDKEEHDAAMIATGMLYGQYWVHLDTGEVEKIEE